MDRIETVGLVVIFIGVAFWLLILMGYEAMQILPIHLSFVIPGFVLRRYKMFAGLVKRE